MMNDYIEFPLVFNALITRSTGGFPRYDGVSDRDYDPRPTGTYPLPQVEGETLAYGSGPGGFFGSD